VAAVSTLASNISAGPYCASVSETSADHLAAFALRFQVYVVEQGKPYASSDHENSTLTDELDPSAVILVVKAGNECCGTVRLNYFDVKETREFYAGVFDAGHHRRFDPRHIGVCSRFAVSSAHRNASVRDLLCRALFDYGLRRGGKVCYAACAPPVDRVFRRYGFKEFLPPVLDPVAGLLRRMVMLLDDIEHLEKIRSPLVAVRNPIGPAPGQLVLAATDHHPWSPHADQ